MLIPLSWLKEYVDIKLPLKELMWRLTEAGLTCETTQKVGEEVVLDVEVTANRPDWMSVVGVAREIAAIQNTSFKPPQIPDFPKKQKNLPMDYKINYEVLERWSAVTIAGISVKPSPNWLQNRLKLVGLRPINNIVDITNYVMFELGIPMHAFDYDEIRGQIMLVEKAKGGEDFTSVDELSYKLPKDAMIIKDTERIIDLCGIKGGFNSGIRASTKNVLIHSTIDNPVLTRRSSIALGLRSDASAIYERGPDKGGTVQTLKRMAGLILRLAGGSIASPLTDIKREKFEPWKLKLNYAKLEKILGIKIPDKEVVKILARLNLNPREVAAGIECTIPTYRADIKIEEDLVEEVARIYGYNKFPKTLPQGQVNPVKIPYYFDDSFHKNLKTILTASGYSETMSLSLLSKSALENFGIGIKNPVKITNPVSLEYEYMRPSLLPSLLDALKINTDSRVQIFAIDKTYPEENYKLAGVVKGLTFRQFKGAIDLTLERVGVENFEIEFETDKNYFHPSKSGSLKADKEVIGEFGELSPITLNASGIKEAVMCFEFDVSLLEKYAQIRNYKSFAENPAQVEDLTLIFPPKTRIGNIIRFVSDFDIRILNFELKGTYKGNYTFRIWYQDPKKNLTDREVEEIRNKILKAIKTKFGGKLKS